MKVVKVLPKGQVVIPKEMRLEVGIEVGRGVIVERVNGSILVFPEPKDLIGAMKGLLEGVGKDSVKTIRKLRKEW